MTMRRKLIAVAAAALVLSPASALASPHPDPAPGVHKPVTVEHGHYQRWCETTPTHQRCWLVLVRA